MRQKPFFKPFAKPRKPFAKPGRFFSSKTWDWNGKTNDKTQYSRGMPTM